MTGVVSGAVIGALIDGVTISSIVGMERASDVGTQTGATGTLVGAIGTFVGAVGFFFAFNRANALAMARPKSDKKLF